MPAVNEFDIQSKSASKVKLSGKVQSQLLKSKSKVKV